MRAILTFHCIDQRDHVLSIRPEELRSLLGAVTGAGFRLVRLEDLLALPASDRAVALTFDDGYRSVHEHARPILKEFQAPGTVFLVSSLLGTAHDPATLGWREVEALRADGWEIGAHTASHTDLRRLPPAAIAEELRSCDAAIEAAVGVKPRSFAYPFGFFSDEAVAVARQHYRCAVSTRMGWLSPSSDPHLLPRLDTFYFRRPAVHRSFGSPGFRAWLGLRALARRARWGRYA
jgi:peptidoglycan/xylan/chitin deacetylase (PgdA/CDA1 family)